MRQTRRYAIACLLSASGLSKAQIDGPDQAPRRLGEQPPEEEERRLPNGKAQRDAIAKKEHEDALRDAERLVSSAKEIRDDLKKAGDYVVPIPTLKKTEEAEKLAKKIRGRLKS